MLIRRFLPLFSLAVQALLGGVLWFLWMQYGRDLTEQAIDQSLLSGPFAEENLGELQQGLAFLAAGYWGLAMVVTLVWLLLQTFFVAVITPRDIKGQWVLWLVLGAIGVVASIILAFTVGMTRVSLLNFTLQPTLPFFLALLFVACWFFGSVVFTPDDRRSAVPLAYVFGRVGRVEE